MGYGDGEEKILFDYHRWANQMLDVAQKSVKKALRSRAEWKKQLMTSLRNFKKGAPSKEGDALVKSLLKDYTFVGFIPNISYMMDKPRNGASNNDLKNIWVHPFSSPTGVFFHKKLPLVVLSNANLKLDDTVLSSIKGNEDLEDVYDVLGITG